MQDAQQRGWLEVSIKMRSPVIGSRMVMGSPIPFRHTRNAAHPNWLKVSCSCGYGTVTERLPLDSRSRRYIRAPSAVWGEYRSRLPSADQQEHGRRIMVNDLLTKIPARLSTERGLCKGPGTQRGRSGYDTRWVKQRCQDLQSTFWNYAACCTRF